MSDRAEEYLIREYALKIWLEEVLCVDDLSAFADEGEGRDLSHVLQNGVILCNLMLNLRTKSIPRVNLGKDLEHGFKKKENINFFLQACEENGILSSKLFRINDLTDTTKGQFMRVIECLEKLAEKADKEWEFYFKLKSVEDVKKKIKEGKVKLSFPEKDKKRAEGILAKWDSVHSVEKKPPPPVPARVRTPEPQQPSPEEEDSLPPFPQRRPSFSMPLPSTPPTTHAKPAPGKINIPSNITNPNTSWGPSKAPAISADVSGLKNRFEQTPPTATTTPTPTTLPLSPRSNNPPPVSPRANAPSRSAPLSPRNNNNSTPSAIAPTTTTPSTATTTTTQSKSSLSTEEIVERGVIRLQALARGAKARREYRNRVRNVAYRENVATEIFKTEEDYVKSLRIVFTAYLDPIKEHMDDNKWKAGPKGEEVELKTFKSLYSDLQVITNYNAKLLSDIEPLVQNWNATQKLGHIFLQLSNFLKVYTQYVKDYEQARMEFTNAKKASGAFRKFMQEQEEKHKDILESQDMSAFLIRPVQRIPRYLLLLKDLTKHTDEDHADYEALHKALAAIENVAIYIEQKAEESDNVHMVTSIQSRFVNKADSLVSAGRKFVRQGVLLVLPPKGKTKRERTMFLFNDILVEAKKAKMKLGDSKMASLMGRKRAHTVAITSNGGKDLRFKKIYQLKSLRVLDMPDDDKNTNWFVLEHTGLGEVILRLYASDKLAKTEWILDLRCIREKLDKDQKQREVFMSSLKGTEKLKQMTPENQPGGAYAPQTTENTNGPPPTLPPKRSSGTRKANPFAPGGGSGIVGAPSTTSTSQSGVKLEKSHSYQTVLNSTKEPEVKGNITKMRSGSFSRATANTNTNNKSASASDLMIQENAEKTTTEKSKKGEPPTVPSKKRLALLHSFNK